VKIHRSNPDSRFTKIPNNTVRDPQLSYQARGLLAEILSRPDDWTANADRLWANARRKRDKPGEGRDRIRAAFTELESAGYLSRERKRGPRGRIVTELHVYDIPVSHTGESVDSHWSDSDKYTSSQAAPATAYQAPADQAPADQAPADQAPADQAPADQASNGNSLSRGIAALRCVPGAIEREVQEVVRQLKADPNVRYPGRYLNAAIERGDAPDLVIGARKRLAESDGMGQASSKRPKWCGACDERTRMIGEDKPHHCPDCHP
jgi:hypothetical protein